MRRESGQNNPRHEGDSDHFVRRMSVRTHGQKGWDTSTRNRIVASLQDATPPSAPATPRLRNYVA